MKKYIAGLAILIFTTCSFAEDEKKTTYEIVKNMVPADKCPIQIKNEMAEFYDCGNYVVSYSKKGYGDSQFFRVCRKTQEGVLTACTYL